MLLEKVFYTYKNNIIGALIGGASGYYAVNKFDNNKTKIIIGVILGSLIGTTLEHKLRAKIAEVKSKNLIEK